jgi:hypothetical protein
MYGHHALRINLNFLDSKQRMVMFEAEYLGSRYTFYQVDQRFVNGTGQEYLFTASNIHARILDHGLVGIWHRRLAVNGDTLSFTLVVEFADLSLNLSFASD